MHHEYASYVLIWNIIIIKLNLDYEFGKTIEVNLNDVVLSFLS
jgi:hypothetical protein